jgi:hypothetical protein
MAEEAEVLHARHRVSRSKVAILFGWSSVAVEVRDKTVKRVLSGPSPKSPEVTAGSGAAAIAEEREDRAAREARAAVVAVREGIPVAGRTEIVAVEVTRDFRTVVAILGEVPPARAARLALSAAPMAIFTRVVEGVIVVAILVTREEKEEVDPEEEVTALRTREVEEVAVAVRQASNAVPVGAAS